MSRLLLDTHVLVWWWAHDPRLTVTAFGALSDRRNDVYVSAASAWEVATKARLDRIRGSESAIAQFHEGVTAELFRHLPITYVHGRRAGSYPSSHSDPFDRMLAAQAEVESLTLVTADSAFNDFPVEVLW